MELRILLIFVYIVQHKQNKMLKFVYFANCKKMLFCYNKRGNEGAQRTTSPPIQKG